ncbi:MAG: DNA-3-methyladenine glycosylase [Halanaerobiales bacterium]
MPLSKSFFADNAVEIARKLIGHKLVRKYNGKSIISRIVETEAYCGPEDKASHAYDNKRTKRTDIMFGEAGYTYIYLIYGMYYCLNVVTANKGIPHAVLIRAVKPISGVKEIKKNRNIKSKKKEDLTNGPGKLCQALNIDKSLNGKSLFKAGQLYIKRGEKDGLEIAEGKRINIDYAEEYRDKKWRFYIKGSSYISG